KSLLTKEEYEKLIDLFKGNKTDYQTNHYFDTSRFSLKALSASLRVRERESLQLTLKRKKGYSINEITIDITKDDLNKIIETGSVESEEIAHELNNLIGNQKLINFLSLTTYRMY